MTPVLHRLRRSGLDTSGGRIAAHLAKIIALIAFAFLVIGVTTGVALFRRPLRLRLYNFETLSHGGGTLLDTVIWRVSRRGRLSRSTLELLDLAVVLGCCTAWALLIYTQGVESVYTGILADILTVLVRSVVVPSTAARTLRLPGPAHWPVTLVAWLRPGLGAPEAPRYATATCREGGRRSA